MAVSVVPVVNSSCSYLQIVMEQVVVLVEPADGHVRHLPRIVPALIISICMRVPLRKRRREAPDDKGLLA